MQLVLERVRTEPFQLFCQAHNSTTVQEPICHMVVHIYILNARLINTKWLMCELHSYK